MNYIEIILFLLVRVENKKNIIIISDFYDWHIGNYIERCQFGTLKTWCFVEYFIECFNRTFVLKIRSKLVVCSHRLIEYFSNIDHNMTWYGLQSENSRSSVVFLKLISELSFVRINLKWIFPIGAKFWWVSQSNIIYSCDRFWIYFFLVLNCQSKCVVLSSSDEAKWFESLSSLSRVSDTNISFVLGCRKSSCFEILIFWSCEECARILFFLKHRDDHVLAELFQRARVGRRQSKNETALWSLIRDWSVNLKSWQSSYTLVQKTTQTSVRVSICPVHQRNKKKNVLYFLLYLLTVSWIIPVSCRNVEEWPSVDEIIFQMCAPSFDTWDILKNLRFVSCRFTFCLSSSLPADSLMRRFFVFFKISFGLFCTDVSYVLLTTCIL